MFGNVWKRLEIGQYAACTVFKAKPATRAGFIKIAFEVPSRFHPLGEIFII